MFITKITDIKHLTYNKSNDSFLCTVVTTWPSDYKSNCYCTVAKTVKRTCIEQTISIVYEGISVPDIMLSA